MSAIVWLFDEAWQRRRSRCRRRWAAGVLLAALALLALTARPAAESPQGRSAPTSVPSSALVRTGSYLAIHCRQPNSIACDQLALAVTLKRPARAITATIDGRSWPMNRWGDELYSSSRPRREFVGFFSHAGIQSRLHVHPQQPGDIFINNARSPGIGVLVNLLVEFPSGRELSTRLRLYLADGWG